MKEDKPSLDTNELIKDLKFNKGDATAAVTKAAISLVPLLGGPAIEIFNAVTTPMLSKRRDKWIFMFAEAINELADKINESSFENLPENEIFITTVMHASQIAIRNHQKEKLKALKNAVINSALNKNLPEDNLQLMFLDYIDSFTPLHIKLLNFFNEPKSIEFIFELNTKIARMEGASEIIGDISNSLYSTLEKGLEAAFPELKGKKDIYMAVINDLESKNMIQTDKDNFEIRKNNYPKDDEMIPEIQSIGKLFLLFIMPPDYEDSLNIKKYEFQ
jgi:hypothetical protein